LTNNELPKCLVLFKNKEMTDATGSGVASDYYGIQTSDGKMAS
jgi:hypothetical protein